MGKRQYPEIGTRMKDGTIYGGISPTTGRPMYVTTANATCLLTFNQAAEYARALTIHGRGGWRVPSQGELTMLFEHRAKIGGFNPGETMESNWYRSSTRHEKLGSWGLLATAGGWANVPDDIPLALRCVCG